ncbi:MAG: hypothetical protein QG621_434 [Patescibacteria group bacterium]|nr:hypothetical protein [Patescibacteria group bacterium]
MSIPLTANDSSKLLLRAQRILTGKASFQERFIPDHQELQDVLEYLRHMGCAIAFTTGVWDLFHIGHGDYIHNGKLEAEKLLPEAEKIILVVGVDTDQLTKERKGPSRPIVPEDERFGVLGHLRPVDIITPQYEANTLYKLVGADVRIVSESTGDLPNLELMQKECKHLVVLPPQSETSTTARIRRLALDGRLEALKQVRGKLLLLAEEIERDLGQQ